MDSDSKFYKSSYTVPYKYSQTVSKKTIDEFIQKYRKVDITSKYEISKRNPVNVTQNKSLISRDYIPVYNRPSITNEPYGKLLSLQSNSAKEKKSQSVIKISMNNSVNTNKKVQFDKQYGYISKKTITSPKTDLRFQSGLVKNALPSSFIPTKAVQNQLLGRSNNKILDYQPAQSYKVERIQPSIMNLPKTKLDSTRTRIKSKKHLKGALYIFNQNKFVGVDAETRIGSTEDVKILSDTFKKFNFNITIHQDYTLKKIVNQVKIIQKKDYSSHSGLVIAILSHGERNDHVLASDQAYNIDDVILFPILENKTLKDKPKIFIIQACKGKRQATIYADSVPAPSIYPTEILKCYSTFEGFLAYRSANGSIFIQTLCKLLSERGCEECIETVMKKVIQEVKSMTNQVPFISSNLTEPFILGDYL